jgi:hypothetical protein
MDVLLIITLVLLADAAIVLLNYRFWNVGLDDPRKEDEDGNGTGH